MRRSVRGCEKHRERRRRRARLPRKWGPVSRPEDAPIVLGRFLIGEPEVHFAGKRPGGRPKSRGPGVAVLTSKGTGGSVVLVAVEVTHDPERWRKSRPPGRARNKPFQPLRAERRMPPARPWRRHSCAFYFAHEAADALAHPAFRAPSFRGRRKRGIRAPPRLSNNRGDGVWLHENGEMKHNAHHTFNVVHTCAGTTRVIVVCTGTQRKPRRSGF